MDHKKLSEATLVFAIITSLITMAFGSHIPQMDKKNLPIGVFIALIGLVGIILSSYKLHDELY